MSVDWALGVGDLITFVAIVAAAFGIFYTMRGDLRVLSSRVGSIEDSMGRCTSILVRVAEQQARLDGHSERIERLETQVDKMK